jgi:hypothetical protein
MPAINEYSSNILPSGYTAPTQYLPSERPAEPQEKQLIKLLLNHGAKEIPQEFQDENGNSTTVNTRVAEVIVYEIIESGSTFDNPVYQQIFQLYKTAIDEQQPLPDANFFAVHNDSLIRNTALTLMLNTYTVSNLWQERKNISIPSLDTHLLSDVTESLLTFKQKKCEQMMQQNSYALRQCKDEEEMMVLLAKQQQLNNLHLKICNELNRVVV